jgi:hypothetical protein
MTKRNTDTTDIEVRADYLNVYKKLGGVANLHKWARNHQTLFYGYLEKLLAKPQLVQTQTNNVNINTIKADGEAARRKIQDALERMIDDRARPDRWLDPAVYVDGKRINDPAAYVNGVRVDDGPLTIEHDPSTASSSTASSSTRDTRHATDDHSPVRADVAAVVASRANIVPQSSIPGLYAGAVLGEGADTGKTTTQLFYEWNGRSGHGRPP